MNHRLPTGAIEQHLSTAGTVRPRRGSRGVATFGRGDAAFTITLIRKRRSTLLLDQPMAASGHECRFPSPALPSGVPGEADFVGKLAVDRDAPRAVSVLRKPAQMAREQNEPTRFRIGDPNSGPYALRTNSPVGL
jgi:hypothetical protein